MFFLENNLEFVWKAQLSLNSQAQNLEYGISLPYKTMKLVVQGDSLVPDSSTMGLTLIPGSMGGYVN